MKLKIKPSSKTKRRYLLLDAKSKKEIEDTILEYIGILGWAKASPLFVNQPKGKSKGRYVLSVERSEISSIRAAFEMSEKQIKVLKVSGTLKGLGK